MCTVVGGKLAHWKKRCYNFRCQSQSIKINSQSKSASILLFSVLLFFWIWTKCIHAFLGLKAEIYFDMCTSAIKPNRKWLLFVVCLSMNFEPNRVFCCCCCLLFPWFSPRSFRIAMAIFLILFWINFNRI